MKLWFLLALVFLVQEPISTGAVILEAYRSHYNIWLIHLLFAAATLIDIVIGYCLGSFIDKKFGRRRMFAWVKRKLEKFSAFIGNYGKAFALIVYAPMLFPVSGLFVPWLNISLTEALIFIFIGEAIFWYLPVWLFVLGIKIFVANPLTVLYIIAIASTVVMVTLRYFSKRRVQDLNL